MFTLEIAGFPRPCTSESLVDTMVGAMNRDQCRELYATVHPGDALALKLIARLGQLADGY
jgi:hypothetical protein